MLVGNLPTESDQLRSSSDSKCPTSVMWKPTFVLWYYWYFTFNMNETEKGEEGKEKGGKERKIGGKERK